MSWYHRQKLRAHWLQTIDLPPGLPTVEPEKTAKLLQMIERCSSSLMRSGKHCLATRIEKLPQ